MVKLKLQFQFFDTAAVMRALDKGTHQALLKAGAYVRRTAKGLTRKKGGRGKGKARISAPGDPPLQHTGALTKNIFFGFDKNNRSVAIGPTKYGRNGAPLLEFGGTGTVKGKTATYRARPFMAPALQQNLSVIPKAFASTVKR